jgi:hypothetical protein
MFLRFVGYIIHKVSILISSCRRYSTEENQGSLSFILLREYDQLAINCYASLTWLRAIVQSFY